ncbi:MAG: 30S ribosomal protein S3 [Proteobacteria bacterium]|jgi:small subunit ribosomal protein S3|nr:30S ribosomal protein S3 [Pseudomonadota bacterium]
MGQKVNPISFRIQTNNNWSSKWFSEKNYAQNVQQDLSIQRFFHAMEKQYFIQNISIDRVMNKIFITVHTSKPGFFVKKAMDGIENVVAKLQEITGRKVSLNVVDVKSPMLSAKLVAISIVNQIEKRASHVRVVKKTLTDVMHHGAVGIKIICSGRLSGAEIARSETYKDGTVPLHTIRAKIDYALVEAHTTYGVIGVKVWICNK